MPKTTPKVSARVAPVTKKVAVKKVAAKKAATSPVAKKMAANAAKSKTVVAKRATTPAKPKATPAASANLRGTLREAIANRSTLTTARLKQAQEAAKKIADASRTGKRTMDAQLNIAKEQVSAQEEIEKAAVAVVTKPMDSRDALKLKAGTHIVASHYATGGGLFSSGGLVMETDGKREMQLVTWPPQKEPVLLTLTMDKSPIPLLMDGSGIEYVLRTPNTKELETIKRIEKERPHMEVFPVGAKVLVEYPPSVEEYDYTPGKIAGIVKTSSAVALHVELHWCDKPGDIKTEETNMGRVVASAKTMYDTMNGRIDVASVKVVDEKAWRKALLTFGEKPEPKPKGRKVVEEPPAILPDRLKAGNGPVRTVKIPKGGKTAPKVVIKTRVAQPVIAPKRVKVSNRMVPKAVLEAGIKHAQKMAALGRISGAKSKATAAIRKGVRALAS